ncbi:MAG: hypothetical protein V4700_04225 [Pseudomonadota bacterium]
MLPTLSEVLQRYRSFFFYTEPSLDNQRTRNPTGKLCITHFLENRPDCWVQYGYQKGEEKKKQLILNDWYLLFLSEKQRDDYLNLVQELLNLEFTVWLPTASKLIRLKKTTDLLSDLQQNNLPYRLSTSASIFQMAAIENIARDHLSIIDYFITKTLFRGNDDDLCCFKKKFYDLIENEPTLEIEDLAKLKSTKPSYYLQVCKEMKTQAFSLLNLLVLGDTDENLNEICLEVFSWPIKRLLFLYNSNTRQVSSLIRSVKELDVDIRLDALPDAMFLGRATLPNTLTLFYYQGVGVLESFRKSMNGMYIASTIYLSSFFDSEVAARINLPLCMGEGGDNKYALQVQSRFYYNVMYLSTEQYIESFLRDYSATSEKLFEVKLGEEEIAFFREPKMGSNVIHTNDSKKKEVASSGEIGRDIRLLGKFPEITVRKYFESCSVREYRMIVNNTLSLEGNVLRYGINTFQPQKLVIQPLHCSSDTEVELKKTDDDIHWGNVCVILTKQTWSFLPSLTVQEKLTAYQAILPLEFAYSDQSNQYCVRLAQSNIEQKQKIQIRYRLEIPRQQDTVPWKNASVEDCSDRVRELSFEENGHMKKNDAYNQFLLLDCNERIAALTKTLRQFGERDWEDGFQRVGGYTDWNYFLNRGVGACRHRAILFFLLAEKFGINSRIVRNDCHAFVEIKYQEQWFKQDLGGSPGELKFEPVIEPVILAQSEVINEKSEVNPPLSSPIIDPIMEAISVLKEKLIQCCQPQAMLIFSTGADIDAFYRYLNKQAQSQQCVLYLPGFKTLQLKTLKVAQMGYELIDSPFVCNLKQLKAGDILLVNFMDYEGTDVGYNTIFDRPRRLGDIFIPDSIIIFAAMDSTTSQRMGEDMLSRLYVKQQWKLPLPESAALQPTIGSFGCKKSVVELYHGKDWREKLIGRFQLTGQSSSSPFTWSPGALSIAITENKPIEIRHAPIKTDRDCQLFFYDLFFHRTIECNGEKIALPSSFCWKLTEPVYDFPKTISMESAYPNVRADFILTPYTVDPLFYTYHCENACITELTGLLLSFKKTLRLYVTHSLDEGIWAKLCQRTNQEGVKLHLILAEDVTLPATFASACYTHVTSEQTVKTKDTPHFAQCYLSNDSDFFLKKLFTMEDKPIVIPIDSTTTYSDLVNPIQVQFTDRKKASAFPSFQQSRGELLKYLADGRTVILKGTFTTELAYQLANLFTENPFFIANGKKYFPKKGKICLLSEQKKIFNNLDKLPGHCESRDFSHEEYMTQLAEDGIPELLLKQFKKKNWNTLGLCYLQLSNIVNEFKRSPDKNPCKPFASFHANPVQLVTTGEKLKKNDISFLQRDSTEEIQEEIQRLKELQEPLDRKSCVFVTGPSGIGKTTLILKKLVPFYAAKGQRLKLSVGMDQVEAWAKSNENDTMQVLFIDEANLSREGLFDRFEGLFLNPPGLFIQGNYYPLTIRHKIILCGNPSEFEGRQYHRFFERHSYTVQFQDWSDTFLVSNITYPLLKKGCQSLNLPLSQKEQKKIAHFFVKAYKALFQETKKGSSLTPRNLEMMVLRLIALYCTEQYQNNNTTVLQKAYLVSYDEVKPYLSKPQRKVWKKHNEQATSYRNLRRSHRGEEVLRLGDYLLTWSRQRALQLIRDALVIRNEQKTRLTTTAGLCGVLLEGSAGIGKSAFVINLLRARGFCESHIDPEKCYYYIPANATDIEKKLTQAFHNGSIVVIDELNTAPLEKTLNALMSGQDLQGNKAERSGFFIFATQNPISYLYRQPLSPALANRFYKIELKDYLPCELEEILNVKGIDPSQSRRMVENYLEENKKTDIPALKKTPRDLLNVVVKERGEGAEKLEEQLTPPTSTTPLSTESEKEQETTTATPKISLFQRFLNFLKNLFHWEEISTISTASATMQATVVGSAAEQDGRKFSKPTKRQPNVVEESSPARFFRNHSQNQDREKRQPTSYKRYLTLR